MAVFYEGGKKYNFRNPNGTPYYRKTFELNGKRRVVYGDGEKDALRKVDELKAQSSHGLDLDHRSSKVGKTFRYWLFDVKRVDKNVKATTFTRYAQAFKHIEKEPICNMNLCELNAIALQSHITSLYEDKHLSSGNVFNVVKLWKMFCAWAVDTGFLIKNPSSKLSMPGDRDKMKKEVEVFTDEERKLILDYMEKTNYIYKDAIKLAFATGIRQGELFALKWSDVDFDNKCLNINSSTAIVPHTDKDGNSSIYREIWDTKTVNSVRSIPLLSSTVDMLRALRQSQRLAFIKKGMPQSEFVFTNSAYHMVDASAFRKSYTHMLKEAGVPYKKFHAIRHTFATEAIKRGVEVKDLQMLMGHSQIATTYIYVHSSDESKRKAIELMGEVL